MSLESLSRPLDTFPRRHLGPTPAEVQRMLAVVGVESLDELVDQAVPAGIRLERPLELPEPLGESGVLRRMEEIAAANQLLRSWIGMGYHGCLTPPVILRNILENPGWYTAYTPYQAEIAQGRLEMLLNFQTVITELTGLETANASLLDEATAAAEAMAMSLRARRRRSKASLYFVSSHCHPQTIAVVCTRAEALGVEVEVGDHRGWTPGPEYFGALLQYPTTDGALPDYAPLCAKAKEHRVVVTMACDLLALTLLRSPGELGADIAVGSSQRFGVPMGYGGPHAAFMSAHDRYRRQLPGRIIGVSKDSHGDPALRMAMQTREQHIRRHKATSNICTAQVLLAVVAGAYAVYHGPDGLVAIARKVRDLTSLLAAALTEAGHQVINDAWFDTLRVRPSGRDGAEVIARALEAGVNLRGYDNGDVGVAFDETTGLEDLHEVLAAFGGEPQDLPALAAALPPVPEPHPRAGAFLEHPVFNQHHSETAMLRYLHRLEARDLALNTSMIPLGSCTMKLNATAEMIPVTTPGFAGLHPFVPRDQAAGYTRLHQELEAWLAELTGFSAISLQPNAGSQGEYAGLLVIRAYHDHRGEGHRDVCLIPTSAHGTNPASAVMAGMRVVAVACDDDGNIDLDDLREKSQAHADSLSALMVTYPSTHGVFEEAIREICEVVHRHGGQVYLDGANMNAQVGLCRPGDYGADVCHLNLHKTFCIPHGGGGPGMGPIGVQPHLAPFLPGHPVVPVGGEQAIGAIAAAPWGSPSILPISYVYIAMMGVEGLTEASRLAILNANYIAERLQDHFPVLYRGAKGRVAHECIIDVRHFKASAGVSVDDIAKRLMDYGFHAPTMSWPVVGTLMIEPTESEGLAELDRFCDAMIAIREEIRDIEEGRADREDNPLHHAPHTAGAVLSEDWSHPYSREKAAFPAPWTREHKFWPAVGRVDNAYGDRHLVCTCPTVEEMAE